MGHRGYTNRAKSGDRASVAHQRQQAARAAVIKQRERSRSKTVGDRPKAKIVIERCETPASEVDQEERERGS